MKQKTNRKTKKRAHTVLTRQLTRIIANLKQSQARVRTRWHDIDIKIGAIEYLITDILEGRYDENKRKRINKRQ